MSTKTSFKRIAAVAAVALTLGGFSAVSANAAAPGDLALFPTVTALSAPTTGTIGTAVTGTFNQSGVVNGFNANSLYTEAYLVAIPATSALAPNSVTVANYTGTTYTNTTGTTETATTTTATIGTSGFAGSFDGNWNGLSWLKVNTPPAQNSTARVNGYFTATFTPDAAGTYVVAVKSLVDTTQVATWTVTVGAQAGPTAYGTTITAAPGGAGSGTAATAIVAPKAAVASYTSATAAETVTVTLGNNTSAAAASTLVPANAPAITATVSGPGVVSWNNTTVGKSVASTAGSVSPVLDVFGDGTAGISTITFTDVDPVTAATVTLGTATVTFYGAAATITPTVVNSVIATGSAGYNVGAITAIVADSNGNPVPGVTVYSVSSAPTVVSNSYTPSSAVSDATGKVSFTLAGVQAGTANITLTLNSSTAGTSTVTTAAIPVRVGSTSVASVKWALDSSSYVPGALATLSVTLLDAAGLPVAPSATAYAVFTAAPTFSLAPALASSALTSGAGYVTVATGSTTGTTTYTFNAPLTAGALAIKATTATLATAANSAVAVELDATITGGESVDAAQAAQDAANEATDAANAATDAANNAMDSADAATAAAQDAGDKADAALTAITDLATKVSDIATQVSSLSAVVAKIAAAVAKISAKVKA